MHHIQAATKNKWKLRNRQQWKILFYFSECLSLWWVQMYCKYICMWILVSWFFLRIWFLQTSVAVSQSKQYAVVEFTDDCSVDVVPSLWLEADKYCSWPPYRTQRLINAVKRCEMPEESWIKCCMRVFHLFGNGKLFSYCLICIIIIIIIFISGWQTATSTNSG